MGSARPSSEIVRFADFELDFRAGELRKQGVRVKLQDQPFQVLQILLEHRGELVNREQLRQRIWPADTFVDFDQGLNNAIKRLREALGDSPDNAQFIETVPRRGYRFIAIPESTPKAFPSLLVMPLENLSGDPEQEYFADGLTDALITSLSKIGSLRVISRTTTMHYKGMRRALSDIVRELKVDKVVEGAVQRSGDRVRVSAQLIDGSTDMHLWAESYESDVRDVLTLQATVAKGIATEVRAHLTPMERTRLAQSQQVNRDAYEAFIRGRYHWFKRSANGLRKASQYFERAIEIDPGYAAAYAGLADTAASAAFWGFVPSDQGFGRAKAVALKALELDETLAEPHAALAFSLQNFDFDFHSAEREFRCCLELSPGYSVGHMWYGACLCATGRFEEGFAEARLGIQLDPLSVILRWATSHYYIFGHSYEAAIQEARTAVEIDPNLPMSRMILGVASECLEDYSTAISEFQEAVRLSGGSPLQLALLARAYGRAGQREDAVRVLSQVKALPREIYVMPYWTALAYEGMNDNDQALKCLSEGYVTRAAWMTYLKVDPRWDNLRSDPRYDELVRKINFPEA